MHDLSPHPNAVSLLVTLPSGLVRELANFLPLFRQVAPFPSETAQQEEDEVSHL